LLRLLSVPLKPPADSRRMLRTRSETRLEEGTPQRPAERGSATRDMQSGDGKGDMLISPRIHPQHRTQGQPGSPSPFPVTDSLQDIPQFRPPNARVIVSSSTRCTGETPRRLRCCSDRRRPRWSRVVDRFRSHMAPPDSKGPKAKKRNLGWASTSLSLVSPAQIDVSSRRCLGKWAEAPRI